MNLCDLNRGKVAHLQSVLLPWRVLYSELLWLLFPQMKGCCRALKTDWAPPEVLPPPSIPQVTVGAAAAAAPSCTCFAAGASSCWWHLWPPSSCSPGSTYWQETWRVSSSRNCDRSGGGGCWVGSWQEPPGTFGCSWNICFSLGQNIKPEENLCLSSG